MDPAPHEVLLTTGAEQDLDDLIGYIATRDSITSAERVLDRLMKVIEGLALFPQRGAYPKELLALGIREYRQTHFKPYRVIYQVVGQQVYVHLIADDRRDMQALLARRLLAG